MATTTSTENSGLLNYLLPAFTKETGYPIHVIAVGTGKALRMGQDGDVDVVLVHALAAEHEFVAHGYGERRYPVMQNGFVILGPASDSAGIGGVKKAAQVMKQVASRHAIFISRGDNSGTNKKEKALWKEAGIKPAGSWYREAGQGMGKVIQMANELQAYTLADRGTWLAYQDKVSLKVLHEGDASLMNPYGIIAVNPKRYPDTNYEGAKKLISWITSRHGQTLIGAFKIHGQRLFIPESENRMAANKKN